MSHRDYVNDIIAWIFHDTTTQILFGLVFCLLFLLHLNRLHKIADTQTRTHCIHIVDGWFISRKIHAMSVYAFA